MNQKLKKALAERERKAQRITEMQARNKELDKMIAELEYTELQDMLRGAGMNFEEFARRFPEMLAAQAPQPDEDSEVQHDDLDALTQEENDDESEEAAQAGEEADGEATDGDDFGGDFGDDAGGDWDLR